MKLRALIVLLCGAIFLTFSLAVSASAATRTVPSASYPTIQSGVDAAQNGDTVLVADGTYTGPGNRDIDFHGKSLTVTSQNGPTKTIIDCGGYASTDGSGNHRGFYIHRNEINPKISGFTIENGYETSINGDTDHASGSGGGICISQTSANIQNCIVTDNVTQYNGGGIFNDNSDNCIVSVANCTVSDNVAGNAGGGICNLNLYSGTITLTGCTVFNNTGLDGGGVCNVNDSSDGSKIMLSNCIIFGNVATGSGGGVANDNYGSNTIVLTNCTITGNSATIVGGGIWYRDQGGINLLTLTNDILYGDTGGEVTNEFGSVSNAVATYCDIQGGYSGTGNIDKDPLFVNATAGDLHLQPGSPCLGKGTPNGAPATDLDGRTRPNPPSMGAYELGSVLNVPSKYPTIQAGIDAALPGDTVLVADGTYSGPGNRDIDFNGKSIIAISQHGPTKTIIDCGGYASNDGSGNHRGFYIHSGETNATISGFTVKNGYEVYNSSIPDSGIGGGISIVNGNASIQNCVFSSNTAQSSGGGISRVADSGGTLIVANCLLAGNSALTGGGISNSDPGIGTLLISSCTIQGNSAVSSGGGIYNDSNDLTTLTKCIIVSNFAQWGGGGGVYDDRSGCITTFVSCTISNNTASSGGGGGFFNDGDMFTMTATTISNNIAGNRSSGGGIFNSPDGYTVSLTNCTISGNRAQDSGGGIINAYDHTYFPGGMTKLTNCTITGNIASGSDTSTSNAGGGIFNDSGGVTALTNDIIYGDFGGEITNNSNLSSVIITYSDVQGGSIGIGNIDKDPLFVNATTGDLHLKPGSPCLGAGTSVGAPTTDLDGNPRPSHPSIGAYELAAPIFTIKLTSARMVSDHKLAITTTRNFGTSVFTVTVNATINGKLVSASQSLSTQTTGTDTQPFILDFKAAGVPRFTKNMQFTVTATASTSAGNIIDNRNEVIWLPTILVPGIVGAADFKGGNVDHPAGGDGTFPNMEAFLKQQSQQFLTKSNSLGEPYSLFSPTISYEYPTLSTLSYLRDNDSFAEGAAKLASLIGLIKAYTWADKVNLVTHSKGGLVSRAYLQYQGNPQTLPQSANTVNRLIMTVPPNTGSLEAKLDNISYVAAFAGGAIYLDNLYPLWATYRMTVFQKYIIFGKPNSELAHLDGTDLSDQDSNQMNLPAKVSYTIIYSDKEPTPETITTKEFISAPYVGLTVGDGVVPYYSQEGFLYDPNNPNAALKMIHPFENILINHVNVPGFHTSVPFLQSVPYLELPDVESEVYSEISGGF